MALVLLNLGHSLRTVNLIAILVLGLKPTTLIVFNLLEHFLALPFKHLLTITHVLSLH